MKFILSHHAQYRSRERGVSFDIIKKVVRSPETTKLKHGGRVWVQKKVEGKTITVVYKKERNNIIIVTVIA